MKHNLSSAALSSDAILIKPDQPPKAMYYLKLIAALLFWAGLYHIATPVAKVADPYLIAFIRFTIAAILLLIVLRLRSGSFVPKLNNRQWLSITCVSLFGGCAYNLLFFNAEALISGSIVAIYYSFSPCLTTIISAYVFKTRLNLLSKLGIFIALVGSIGVVNYAAPECQQFFCSNIFKQIGLGQIYGILATVVFSCYAVLNRYTAMQKVSGLVINTYSAVIGAIILGIVAMFKADFSHFGTYGVSFWLAMGYMSALATVVAYLWYTDALIHLGVFKTVVFQNTVPLQAILVGYLFFNDKIDIGVLFCGLIILFGVYLTNIALTFKKKLKNP